MADFMTRMMVKDVVKKQKPIPAHDKKVVNLFCEGWQAKERRRMARIKKMTEETWTQVPLPCGKKDVVPQDEERTPPAGDMFGCNHPNCYYFREGGKPCKPHHLNSCSEEDRA